jgi:hypothetical protein
MSTPGQPELDAHGMPVLKMRAEGQDHAGGHQAVHMTYPLSAQNPVLQLLPRDYSRLEAKVLNIASGTPAGTSLSSYGAVTGPTALQNIASLALPAGTYQVAAATGFGGSGDTSGVETDNYGIYLGAAQISVIMTDVVGANTATVDLQPVGVVVVPAGGGTLTLKAIGAGTVTAQYRGLLIATPLAAAAAGNVVLAQSKEIAEFAAQAGAAFAGPSGSLLPPGVDRTMRSCDELWAAWTGTPVLVSVIVARRLNSTAPNTG